MAKISITSRLASWSPVLTTSIVYARPLPLVPEERPDAGPDFGFRVVYDPDDRYLAQIESPERLEQMRGAMARGVFAILAIHEPTDRAMGRIWVAAHTPAGSGWRCWIPAIRLARDEVYLLDTWIEPEFRRQAVAMTMVYELSAFADARLDQVRWVYCLAHKDNTASRPLFEAFFGPWAVQQVTTIDWRGRTVLVPFSDQPRIGPFSRVGLHDGVHFGVPGRATTDSDYCDYHHPDGFERQKLMADVADDWPPPGDDWFDRSPALDADGRPGVPDTAPRIRP